MYISKRLVLFVSLIISAITFALWVPTSVVAQTSSINIWWPTDNATVSGVQPFKARIDGMPIDTYQMYWQVDGGQLNSMSMNTTDAPHKEASVDLTGWHWSTTGSYVITFVAKNSSGAVIAQRSATIHVSAPSTPTASLPAAPPVVSQPVTPPVVQPLVVVPPPVVVPPSIVSSMQSVNVWWPINGVTVTNVQPFKAELKNTAVSAYNMFWQVDGGGLNQMSDNNTDAPHKESSVDLSGWSWHGSGPYAVTFVAKNVSGAELGRATVSIYTGSHAPSPILVTPTPVPVSNIPVSVTPSPTPVPSSNPVLPGDPLSGLTFYVDPHSNAVAQVQSWSASSPANAAEISKIASQSQAMWLGDWNANIYNDTKSYVDAASAAGSIPVLVAYDIPQRDCGSYSAGGANGATAYKTWISNLAQGIGSRTAVVILEPDALAMVDCLSSTDATTRYNLLNFAVSTLKAHQKTMVYMDAGNSNWIGANTMADRLKNAGIAKADGFALNVSNYYWTNDNINFGQSVSAQTGGKHFVVDTSRNGLGPDGGNWCNPSGRAIGVKPTTQTGNSLTDAFLWLKRPGESDGACNGGPSAGVWWPAYALGLAERATY